MTQHANQIKDLIHVGNEAADQLPLLAEEMNITVRPFKAKTHADKGTR